MAERSGRILGGVGILVLIPDNIGLRNFDRSSADLSSDSPWRVARAAFGRVAEKARETPRPASRSCCCGGLRRTSAVGGSVSEELETDLHVAGADDVRRILLSLLFYWPHGSGMHAVDQADRMGSGRLCESFTFSPILNPVQPGKRREG